MPEAVALSVHDLSKTYAGTLALHGVDLDIRPGEIHALVGGNGSGKSTLIKLLAGVVPADEGGAVAAAGGPRTPVEHWSADRAHAAGLRFVHQQAAIFPELTVAENLAIGAGFPTAPRTGPLHPVARIRWRELHARTRALLERYHVQAEPTTPVRLLRAADRSRVAIVRALQDRDEADSGILVLDEPTAALPEQEAEELLAALRRYAAAGQTILYVSHRLGEVLSLADRVTVLRDGRRVATVEAADLTEPQLVELIVGRSLDRLFPEATAHTGCEESLGVAGLAGGPLTGVDLSLRYGEVLGIAGLLGSGRSELLRMIFGAHPVDAGTISLDRRPVRFASPAAAMAAGIAYVPEERQADAVFAGEPVRHNLSAGRAGAYYRWGLLRHGRERAATRRSMTEFLVRAASDRLPIEALSGGNQQKVVLARWLRERPRVLLLDEPTQGVDVGARSEIYELVRRATRAGTSVLLVASDPEELAHVCDRVAVLRGGRITTVVDAPLDAHQLTDLMNFSEAS
ncbi:sugar ABC transporter ATP-binding protein [Actinomadura scrupuli]|uniref:sugar ABC transporter ATP-binding protein n=1 Tax=Actinomadura scrupuli TaxID=559629 RepID=UPI003D999453